MPSLALVAALITLVAILLFLWQFARRPRLLLPLALLALLVNLAQMTVEGFRWLLFPLYSLSILLVVVMVLLMLFLPRFRLPEPTGPYAVGTVTQYWVDEARHQRPLLVQFWYPASRDLPARAAPYMHHAELLGHAFGVPGWLLRHLNFLPTQSGSGAPLASDQQTYPLLLFSHGLGGVRTQNTFQCQELASHGYIVAAVDHTDYAAYVLFPDGKMSHFTPQHLGMTPDMMARINHDPAVFTAYFQAIEAALPVLAGDQSFVLDQLTKLDPQDMFARRVDLDRVGAWGHSLGGTTALYLASTEPRCKAAMSLDGPAFGPIQQRGTSRPICCMGSTNTVRFTDPHMQALSQDMIHGTLDRTFAASSGDRYRMELAQSGHFNFSDAPLLVPRTLGLGRTVLGPIGTHGLPIINAYALAFVNADLQRLIVVPGARRLAATLDVRGVAEAREDPLDRTSAV